MLGHLVNFPPEPVALLYRVDDAQYAACLDEFGDSSGQGRLSVNVTSYVIRSYTAFGAWIDGPRFVNLRASKQFACASKAEAIASFKARKNRQIRILSTQLDRAERALALIESPEG